MYLRYFQPMKLSTRTAHERLTRICFIDYDREMALVAERRDPAGGEPQILGVTRLSKIHGTDSAESAVVILDEVQHQGLGTELVRRSLDVARAEKLKKVISNILPENFEMRAVCQRLGFTHAPRDGGQHRPRRAGAVAHSYIFGGLFSSSQYIPSSCMALANPSKATGLTM